MLVLVCDPPANTHFTVSPRFTVTPDDGVNDVPLAVIVCVVANDDAAMQQIAADNSKFFLMIVVFLG